MTLERLDLFTLVTMIKSGNLQALFNAEYIFFLYKWMYVGWLNVKGMVYPKMKNLSFSSSCSKPNVSFLFFCWTQKRDISKNVGSQTLWHPLTSIVFFPHSLEINGDQKLFSNLIFIFNRRKKIIQVWSLMVSKWWQNFHFWVNFPFK